MAKLNIRFAKKTSEKAKILFFCFLIFNNLLSDEYNKMDFNKLHNHIKKSILSYLATRIALQAQHFSGAFLSYQRAKYFEHLSLNSFSAISNLKLEENQDSYQRNAVWYFLNAALQGYSTAQFKLGMLYLNGQLGLDSNEIQALRWLNLAADQGHLEAQHEISKIIRPS